MLNEFLTALGISVGAMFPIINPVGHAPMFYAVTQDDTPAFRRRTAFKTSLYTGALNRILGLVILAIGVALVTQGVKSMLLPR